jgi:hypothetical protein
MAHVQTTVAALEQGDRFTRMMRRWEVVAVGDRLTGDTRRPVDVLDVATGEQRTFAIRDTSEVWVARKDDAR